MDTKDISRKIFDELTQRPITDDWIEDDAQCIEIINKNLIDVFKGKWHKYPDEKPDKEGYYIVSHIKPYQGVMRAYYDIEEERFIGIGFGDTITNWMYEPDENQ